MPAFTRGLVEDTQSFLCLALFDQSENCVS